MNINYVDVEKRNLGVRTCEISAGANDTFTELEAALPAIDAEYIVVKTPASSSDFLWGMGRLGFTFMEAQLYLRLKKQNFVTPPPIRRFIKDISLARLQTEGDAEYLYEQILSGIFDTDRIALDGHFSKELSAVRYKNWTNDMLTGSGHVVEVLISGRRAGFFAAPGLYPEAEPTYAKAGLAAMYTDFMGKGFGTLLIWQMTEYLLELGTDTVHTAVSSNNRPIINIHQSVGYTVEDIAYVYVLHR
ncbi:MAG: GNAT family N-acetyltransferase [Christensenellaceae bacterium]|jgi:hypothetical protein